MSIRSKLKEKIAEQIVTVEPTPSVIETYTTQKDRRLPGDFITIVDANPQLAENDPYIPKGFIGSVNQLGDASIATLPKYLDYFRRDTENNLKARGHQVLPGGILHTRFRDISPLGILKNPYKGTVTLRIDRTKPMADIVDELKSEKKASITKCALEDDDLNSYLESKGNFDLSNSGITKEHPFTHVIPGSPGREGTGFLGKIWDRWKAHGNTLIGHDQDAIKNLEHALDKGEAPRPEQIVEKNLGNASGMNLTQRNLASKGIFTIGTKNTDLDNIKVEDIANGTKTNEDILNAASKAKDQTEQNVKDYLKDFNEQKVVTVGGKEVNINNNVVKGENTSSSPISTLTEKIKDNSTLLDSPWVRGGAGAAVGAGLGALVSKDKGKGAMVGGLAGGILGAAAPQIADSVKEVFASVDAEYYVDYPIFTKLATINPNVLVKLNN